MQFRKCVATHFGRRKGAHFVPDVFQRCASNARNLQWFEGQFAVHEMYFADWFQIARKDV